MHSPPPASDLHAADAARHSLTRRYNVRHRKWGRLFGDRYKAVVVEGEDRRHYQTLMDYIHLNPVRARMIRPKAGQSVMDYAWSSLARGFALPPKKRAKWLDAAVGLKALNLADTVTGRRTMVERLDKRAVSEEIKSCGVPPRTEEVKQRASHLRRGWYWGTQAFGEAMRKLGQKLLKKAAPLPRAYKKHELVREQGERQAEAWLARGLKAGGLKPGSPSERIRSEEGAAGGPAVAADGCFAGVAGREAGDEIGGECEPAIEAS